MHTAKLKFETSITHIRAKSGGVKGTRIVVEDRRWVARREEHRCLCLLLARLRREMSGASQTNPRGHFHRRRQRLSPSEKCHHRHPPLKEAAAQRRPSLEFDGKLQLGDSQTIRALFQRALERCRVRPGPGRTRRGGGGWARITREFLRIFTNLHIASDWIGKLRNNHIYTVTFSPLAGKTACLRLSCE